MSDYNKPHDRPEAPALVHGNLTSDERALLDSVRLNSPEIQEREQDRVRAENRLLFARWLVEQGKLSEQLEGGDE